MSLVELLAHPACRLLTLALLHFLWQGAAVVALLVVVVELGRIRRAAARYVCSLGALVVMLLCPLATLAWLSAAPVDHSTAASLGSLPHYVANHPVNPPVVGLRSLPPALAAVQPYALAAWLAGVALFGGRLAAGAIGLARLRRSRQPLSRELSGVVERLGRRLKMNALPLVFLSRDVAEAMAVGVVRPLVLIPASWATEMPLAVLEAVIAHELAHLARRDLWVNLLQRLVETLLFYHPAVWWLSRRLRIERELCADELAVAATGQRLAYAQALEQVALRRQAEVRPALAAFLRGEPNMRLLQRVQNVLGLAAGPPSRLWPAGIVALALPVALWLAAAGIGAAVADERKADQPVAERPRKEGPRDSEVRKEGEREEVERKFVRKEGERPAADARLDELAALVKRLSAQVERLQDEVAALRGEKSKPAIKTIKEPAAREKAELKEQRLAELKEAAAKDGLNKEEVIRRQREKAAEQKEEALRSSEGLREAAEAAERKRAFAEKREREARKEQAAAEFEKAVINRQREIIEHQKAAIEAILEKKRAAGEQEVPAEKKNNDDQ